MVGGRAWSSAGSLGCEAWRAGDKSWSPWRVQGALGGAQGGGAGSLTQETSCPRVAQAVDRHAGKHGQKHRAFSRRLGSLHKLLSTLCNRVYLCKIPYL